MPYNPASDEYFWGKCFARDGSDYDPNYPSPKLSDAYRVLKRHFSHDTVFQVAICGKLRYGLTSVGG